MCSLPMRVMPCSVVIHVGINHIEQGSAGHVGWKTDVSVLSPISFMSLLLCLEIVLGESIRLPLSP